MRDVFAGPSAVLRAAGLLAANPRLLPLALVPAAVALGLSILGIWAAVAYGDDLVAWLWPEPADGLAHGLWWALTAFVSVFTAALSLLLTPWLVMLVGFPLCEPLAAKVDALLGGRPVEGSLLGEMARTLTSTLGVVALGLAGAVFFFVLGLIPGAALVTVPFVAVVWTPLFLSFDLLDSSLSRRQLGFRQKVRVVTGAPLRSVSLGLTASLLISVPVVNLLGLPLAVLAGVIVVRDAETAGRLPRRPTQAKT